MPFDEFQALMRRLAYNRSEAVAQAAKAEREPIPSVRGYHREEAEMARYRCREIITMLNANMATGVDPKAQPEDFGAQLDAFLAERVAGEYASDVRNGERAA